MKKVFLESHHINNLYFGFGQFNFHLLKALHNITNPGLKFVVHAKDINFLKSQIGNGFDYKKYYSLRRYPAFRIREKYDLWHSLNQNSKIEPYNNLPVLLTVHDHPNIKDPENYMHIDEHKIFQEKLDKSTALTYISNYTKESTHRYYNVPKVPEYVIYNGNTITDISVPDNFKPKYTPSKPYLFTIGVAQPRKNFMRLVEMMLHLPEMELIIAGSNATKAGEELKSLIKKHNLESRVTLTGQVTDADKMYYYTNCSAFVFPSRREGFGLPVIEAMRFGKPVFLSDMSCLPEIGGDVANYWHNLDAEYMAGVLKTGMEAFYDNEAELSQKLVQRSMDFNWDTAALEYYKVYQELLK